MEDRHGKLYAGPDGAPLYRQLYRHIVEEIASGGLAAGEKLPSKRRLAADLRVSVSTVETAYQMLVAEGYIAARAKSGFTVCRIEKLDAPVRPAPAAPPEPPAKRWAYDFGTGSVDTALFPFKTWARIQRETVTAHPELLNHGSRQGDASLRAAIAKYLHAYRGVVCAPEQIVVGAGIEYLVGLLARLMSQALRKLAGSIAKTNCIVIFINQLREKVGVIYGNPEVTTGGRALKFYSSVRIDVRRTESLKNGSEIIGNRTRARVVKNKVAPPFKEAEFDIMYGEGISKVGELVDLGVKLDLIQKSGSWFAMGETRLGQGRDAVKQYLKENPEVAERIEADIRANAYKLMSSQARAAARAAGRAVDVSAEDFEDADQ